MRVFHTLATLAALVSPSQAEVVVSDAFGVFVAPSASRGEWAGLTEILQGGVGGQVRTVAPGPVDMLLFYLGEKSLVAGSSGGQAVVIGLDASGNLVADGQDVGFSIGAQPLAFGQTTRGLASHRFEAGAKAGIFHAGASTGSRQTVRAEFRVDADLASIIPELSALPEAPLRVEDLHQLETAPMLDRFGNMPADGVGISLILAHDANHFSLLPAVSLGGQATAALLTRDLPPRADTHATLLQRDSQTVPLSVATPAMAAPLEASAVSLPDIAALRLRVGPMVSTVGYMLNDGAPVRVDVVPATGPGITEQAWVFDGMIEMTVMLTEAALPLSLTVTSALGTSQTTIVAPSPAPTGGVE